MPVGTDDTLPVPMIVFDRDPELGSVGLEAELPVPTTVLLV